MKKDDTGNLGLEELLEGGDESTGHKREEAPTGARPIANASMPSMPAHQTSGRMAGDGRGSDRGRRSRRQEEAATAQVAVVVVVLVLVLASAGMAIYYFKH